ncbi:hypothetical protein [Antiquaquibacter soli]|uniref:Lipoprotein n=1 Tax=Antiquaquibacter soli TaxID=3064523 RepID=A0ABT9BN70_9MICO|nr:hypothetical protein [Protaetiibacter sp. WY-16]MDO7882455.1 hypothetical protein [Protaetiibacter sp. WY-16]
MTRSRGDVRLAQIGGTKGPVLRGSAVTIGVGAAAGLVLAALSGCVVVPGSGLTAEEARTELYDSLDRTETVLGGLWDNRDDPTARGCLIPLWVEGEHYPGLRLGSAPDDRQAAANSVRDTWTEWGYRVTQTLVGEVIELQGRSSVGELLVFRVTEEAMTLQGESECRPE